MTDLPALAMDRYISAIDRAVADPARLGEVLRVFAPEAVVEIAEQPVRGAEAIEEFYRKFVADHAESKHFWNTTVLPDGRQRTVWAYSARMADGSVATAAGIEHTTTDVHGRIIHLHNEFTRPPQ